MAEDELLVRVRLPDGTTRLLPLADKSETIGRLWDQAVWQATEEQVEEYLAAKRAMSRQVDEAIAEALSDT
jgi:hypothetical protein